MGKIKSFFKKLNSASPAAKASFWFVVSSVMLKGISFITTPIFTRLLGPEDYGITSVFVSWEGVISIFATLSLAGGVYNVAQTKYGDDIDGYTSSMMALTATASLLVYSVCIGINLVFPELFQLNTAYLVYMWLQTLTNAAITFWLMRKRFVYDYKSVIIYTLANALLSPAIAIVGILLFPENAAMAKVIGAGISGIAIGIFMMVFWFVRGRKFFNAKYWGYALKFNVPLLPHLLAGTILGSSDKLMINSMVSTAAAGIYGIAHSITGLVGIITQAINHSLIPYTMQSIKSGNLRGLKKTVTACVAIVSVVCMCVMLFAKEGILIFATEEFIDAVWYIAPLTLSVLFSFIYGIVGNIMYYYEKTWQMSLVTICLAAVNLVTNYFGIIWFGPVAAGYTTLICSVLQMVIYYFVVRRYEKHLSEIVDLRWFFVIIAVCLGLMVYSTVFYDIFWARFGLISVAAATVVVLRKRITRLFKSMSKNEEQQASDETSQLE